MVYWRDLYNTNIISVDSERKLFFSILNQVERENFIKQRSLADHFISELSQKLSIVFDKEIIALHKAGCPSDIISQQEVEHLEFIDEVEKLKSRKEGSFAYVVNFINLLKSFVINHILGTDLESKIFIKTSYVHRMSSFEKSEIVLIDLVERNILVKWNSFFETGISEIDRQHKMFVDVVNDLVVNHNIYPQTTLVDIVEELIYYTKVHFSTEESYMEEVKDAYNDIELHKTLHKNFEKHLIEKLKNFINKKNKIIIPEESEKLLKELIGWLSEHIVGTDQKFAKIYLEEHSRHS